MKNFNTTVLKNHSEKNWIQDKVEINHALDIPAQPSAFPLNSCQLCESKVDLICGPSSPIVSG